MLVDHALCVGCGNCVPVCPMAAIYVVDRRANINQDECVECGACIRFLTPEDLNPWFVRTIRRTLASLRLRYDQPMDICPTTALVQNSLEWPRVVRQAFSDPTVQHPGTGVKGRGTEEIKTNDVTGRLIPGEVGILVEFGRPGTGARFSDVQRVSMALVPMGVRFEDKNPITQLMVDRSTGQLDPSILNEKVLSCILEVLVPTEAASEVLGTLQAVASSLQTVVSLVINARAGPDGEVPYEEAVAQAGLRLSPNGKTNLGLGRAIVPARTAAARGAQQVVMGANPSRREP